MRTQLNDHALRAQPRQVEEHQKKEKQAGDIKNPTPPDRDVVRPRTPYVGAPGELPKHSPQFNELNDLQVLGNLADGEMLPVPNDFNGLTALARWHESAIATER